MVDIADGNVDGLMVTDVNYHEYFNFINFPRYQMHFTKDTLVRISATFFYSKTSIVLRQKCDKKIRLLQTHGLIDRYQRMFRGMRRDSRQKRAKQLRLARVTPIFRICGILCAIAFLVFLLELFAHRFAGVRRILEYLTY